MVETTKVSHMVSKEAEDLRVVDFASGYVGYTCSMAERSHGCLLQPQRRWLPRRLSESREEDERSKVDGQLDGCGRDYRSLSVGVSMRELGWRKEDAAAKIRSLR